MRGKVCAVSNEKFQGWESQQRMSAMSFSFMVTNTAFNLPAPQTVSFTIYNKVNLVCDVLQIEDVFVGLLFR